MAYGKRYHTTWWNNKDSIQYGVDIYKDEYSGNSDPIDPKLPEPLTWNIRGDFQDTERLIFGREVTFGFFIESSDYDDLIESTYQTYYLVYKDITNGTTLFKGWIKPENISRTYITNVLRQFKLTATDGLADLKDIEFKQSDGTFYKSEQTMLWTIKEALSKIDNSGVLQLPFRIKSNIYETGTGNMSSTDCALEQSTIDLRRFIKNEGGKTKGWNCYKVIESILFDFTAKLKQVDATYRITDYNETAYADANSLTDYVYEIPWDLSTVNRTSVNNIVDISDYNYKNEGELRKFKPLKGYSLRYYRKNLGDPLESVDSWDQDDGEWNVSDATVMVEDADDLRLEVSTSTSSATMLSASFSVTKNTDEDYIKLRLEHHLFGIVNFSGIEGQPAAYARVECIGPDGSQGAQGVGVFGDEWEVWTSEFNDKFRVTSSGDYQLKIYIEPMLSSGDADAVQVEFTGRPEVTIISKGGEDTFDENLVITQNSGFGIPEIETYFGDARNSSEVGRIDIDGSISSSWNRYNRTDDSPLLHLTLQERLNNRQNYSTLIKIQAKDYQDTITPEKVIKLDGNYYEPIGIKREVKNGNVSLTLKQLFTSDVSSSIATSILNSVDGTSTQDPYTESGGTTSVDFDTHSVTELNDVSVAGGGKISDSSVYNALHDANAQLSALHTGGNPTFGDITLPNGSVNSHIGSTSNPHGTTLQKVTDVGNSTSNFIQVTSSNKVPTGTGLELVYSSANDRGIVQAKDRDGGTDKPLRITGSSIDITGGNVNITDGTLSEQGSRVATRVWSTLQNVTDQGNSTSNSVTAAGINSTSNITADGVLQVDGTGMSYFAGDVELNNNGNNIIVTDVGSDFTPTSGLVLRRYVDGTGTAYIRGYPGEFSGRQGIHFETAAGNEMVFTHQGKLGLLKTSPDEALDVDGNGQFAGFIAEPTFVSAGQSNWSTGEHYKIWQDGDAEFQNLKVRGGLQVYELVINRLRSISGGFLVGPGNGKIESVADATAGAEQLYFEDASGNTIAPFAPGMIIVVKDMDLDATRKKDGSGTVLKEIWREVSATQTNGRVDLTTTTGWGTADDVGSFEKGDEVIAVGDTGGTYDANIYMSVTDANQPFIKIMDEIDSYSDFMADSKTRVHIGNLRNFTDYADADLFGLAAGDPSGDNITVDPTNGVRFRNGNTVAAQFTSELLGFGSTTFGNQGIQLDYNGGTPKAYIGDGNTKYFQWDGTDINFNASNIQLDSATPKMTFYDENDEIKWQVNNDWNEYSVNTRNSSSASGQSGNTTGTMSVVDRDFIDGWYQVENISGNPITVTVEYLWGGTVRYTTEVSIGANSISNKVYFQLVDYQGSTFEVRINSNDTANANIESWDMQQYLGQLRYNKRALHLLSTLIYIDKIPNTINTPLDGIPTNAVYEESDGSGNFYLKTKGA